MDSTVKSMTGFPSGVFSAIVVTASLFVTLPLLTQLQQSPDTRPVAKPILIDTHRPAPPPPETRDDSKEQTLPETKITERKDRPQRLQPKVDLLRAIPLMAGDIGIDIGIPRVDTGIVPVAEPTYTPEEVDQAPRLLRSFPPQYPYVAKRDNIEGWVVLRFVVDTEGSAEQVEVAASEPAGIFEAAAMKAVARYRFKPALKGGQAVNCVVKQQIRFFID